MNETFIPKNFSPASLETIQVVNKILQEYRKQGFRLSLRQLYYQLVARDYIPNNLRSYKNLGNLVSDARQAGQVDWEMIEDRNRETESLTHWKNPAEIIEAAYRSFRTDNWENQPWHIEVMVEKDALSGVLLPICNTLDIGITANKGYSSSSTMYEIGKRLAWRAALGKQICVIYLGDHDPSGIDMTRDIEDRLALYSRLDDIDVVRVALNWEQIELWRPPENPAKVTDSRFIAYAEKYGESSWELDAVEPRELAGLIAAEVYKRRDEKLWLEAQKREKKMQDQLLEFAQTYEEPGEEDVEA